jgi:agmatinase
MIVDYDPNSIGNPNNNIFGLPSSEENSALIIIPVPWEVTVSYNAGTARCGEAIFKASLQIDLYDSDYPHQWKNGIYMKPVDKKILLKSDYLRKEAELYLHYISEGDALESNQFMCKTIREINEGGVYLNDWVYQQTKAQLDNGKLVALLGGDHSTPLGYFKAMAEKYEDFGILQIDAHCDLRKAFEGFNYSHASIMYNALTEINAISRLVQVGIRDYCDEEWEYIKDSNYRVVTYFDKDIKERQFEGESWKSIVQDIVHNLPQHVLISFDIDGLDRKLCPNTGTPVTGGFETEQVFYLFKEVLKSGRKIIGFDLNEVGVNENEWDQNVGARVLYKLSNLLLHSNLSTNEG